MTSLLETYIINGGTYGNQKNLITVRQTRAGGGLHYAVQRIWLPYAVIRRHYPILSRYKFLTPLFQMVRWIKLLFGGGVKRSLRELRVNAEVSDIEKEEMQILLE